MIGQLHKNHPQQKLIFKQLTTLCIRKHLYLSVAKHVLKEIPQILKQEPEALLIKVPAKMNVYPLEWPGKHVNSCNPIFIQCICLKRCIYTLIQSQQGITDCIDMTNNCGDGYWVHESWMGNQESVKSPQLVPLIDWIWNILTIFLKFHKITRKCLVNYLLASFVKSFHLMGKIWGYDIPKILQISLNPSFEHIVTSFRCYQKDAAIVAHFHIISSKTSVPAIST